MKPVFNFKGFTLVEAMVTLAVTAVIMAGIATTFSRVNTSAAQTSNSADLTNSTRSLANVIGTDFANAGRGFSDLMALNIHYKFSPDFYDPNSLADTHMYAISALEVDADGYSAITLHWFEYDSRSNPSFLFLPAPSADLKDGGTVFGNQYDELQSIEPGDIFLIYNAKGAVLQESNKNPWQAAIEAKDPLDTSSLYYNDAIIVQIAAATNYQESSTPPTLHQGMGARLDLTFDTGPAFTNNLEIPLDINPDYITQADNYTEEFQDGASTARKRGYTLNQNYWVARKLGGADSFRRVIYEVQNGVSSADPKVLVRTENGSPEIIATDAKTFEILLGLDVDPGQLANPNSVSLDDMDGLVSRLEDEYWIDGGWGDRVSVTPENRQIALGRHTVQAEVSFTQWGIVDKSNEKVDGEFYHRRRGFVQQYRLRNVSAPIPPE